MSRASFVHRTDFQWVDFCLDSRLGHKAFGGKKGTSGSYQNQKQPLSFVHADKAQFIISITDVIISLSHL